MLNYPKKYIFSNDLISSTVSVIFLTWGLCDVVVKDIETKGLLPL